MQQSSVVNAQADHTLLLIQEMLEATRNNDFGQRFFTCADEIFYCHETISKECKGNEKMIRPEVLWKFLEIKIDFGVYVQSLENSHDGRERKIAEFISELISFVEVYISKHNP
jgi:hypothetical protein